ncbi:MAG: TrmH family RNA methyltransferase [Eubacteriales bacterium]
MLKEEEKFAPSTVMEGMTSIRAVLKGQTTSNNDRKIEKILFQQEKEAQLQRELGYLRAMGREKGFEVLPVEAERLHRLCIGSSHGGVVALTGERKLPALSEALKAIRPDGLYVLLEGIEDPYNFGYALRSLYACGADGIILPPRNWMSAAGVVARASAGASELFDMFTADATEALSLFHGIGYRTVCADARADVTLQNCALPCPLLLLVGGERRGLSAAVRQKADMQVRIAYGRDFPAALSAASAATLFGYEIARQNRKIGGAAPHSEQV